MENPFTYSHPIAPPDLIGRAPERADLLSLARGGHYATVIAPRRYGKTSLLQAVQDDARAQGMPAVQVDFSGVVGLREATVIVEDSYRGALQGRARRAAVDALRYMRSVRAGSVEVGIEVAGAQQEWLRLFGRMLELPVRVAERTTSRVLVIFDEFQDLLAAGDRLDGFVRSHIQHHGDAASYIFAGSQTSLMRELFTDRARPFYGQAQLIKLDPLDNQELSDQIAARFEATGRDPGEALDALLSLAAGHPQRAMLLAHALWRHTPRGATADATTWSRAEDWALDQVAPECEGVWASLDRSERAVLAAVAAGERALLASGALERHGLTKSAAQYARDKLIASDYLRSGVGGAEPVDPLLGLWIRQRRLRSQ
jgi:hypothetical protein